MVKKQKKRSKDSKKKVTLVFNLNKKQPEPKKRTKKKIEELIKGLNSSNKVARSMAARNIVDTCTNAVPYLIEGFKLPNTFIKCGICETLGMMGKKVVPELIKALDSETYDIRAGAVRSLGMVGDEKALPILIKFLQNPEGPLAQVSAEAIAKIKDNVPELNKYMKNAYDRDQIRIAFCMAGKGNKKAIPYLIKAVKMTEERRDEISSNLENYEIEMSDSYDALIYDTRKAFVKIGKPALPALKKALKSRVNDVVEREIKWIIRKIVGK